MLCLCKRTKFIGSSSAGWHECPFLRTKKTLLQFKTLNNNNIIFEHVQFIATQIEIARMNVLWYFSFFLSLECVKSIKPCIKYYCWSVNKSTWINQVSRGFRLSLASMPYNSTNVDILLHQFSRLLTLQRLIRLRDLICFDVNACSRRTSKEKSESG